MEQVCTRLATILKDTLLEEFTTTKSWVRSDHTCLLTTSTPMCTRDWQATTESRVPNMHWCRLSTATERNQVRPSLTQTEKPELRRGEDRPPPSSITEDNKSPAESASNSQEL